jgi:hypothetical protein
MERAYTLVQPGAGGVGQRSAYPDAVCFCLSAVRAPIAKEECGLSQRGFAILVAVVVI